MVEGGKRQETIIPMLLGDDDDGSTSTEFEGYEEGQMLQMNLHSIPSQTSALVEQAQSLLAMSNYEGVITLLGNSATTSSGDIDGKILLAESYLMLDRETEASMIIKALKRELMALYVDGSEIVNVAKKLTTNSAHIRAMILLPIAFDIFRASRYSPDGTVKKLYECISEMHDPVNAMIKAGKRRREIAVKFGIYSMEQMQKNLSSIKNADADKKVLKQAWSLHWIAVNYNDADELEKSLKPLRKGIKLLEKKFHGDQGKYRVYGYLLHNIGFARFNLTKLRKAKKYYLKAFGAFCKATDYSSDADKRETIETSGKHVRDICATLGKTK